MSYVRKEERERERTFNELLTDLSWEVRDLLRQEMLLAKNEMTAKLTRAAGDMKSAAIGGAVLHAGFFAIVAAAVLLLGNVVSYWLSALIVGAAACFIGYYMVKNGVRDMRKINITPTETISTLREDEKWLKEKV
jgi:hypothetical protein